MIIDNDTSRSQSPRAAVRRRPAAVFVVLAFALTWSIWVPRALVSQGWLTASWPVVIGDYWAWGPASGRRPCGSRVPADLVDQRDWDAVAALFADEVEVDYTSLNGGEPATVAPADLVDGWRANLERLDATQHLIAGPLVTVDGDTATCVCNVQGTHVRANPGQAGPTSRSGAPRRRRSASTPPDQGGRSGTTTTAPARVVGGRYDMGLIRTTIGWMINSLTLTVTWAVGNQAIMQP